MCCTSGWSRRWTTASSASPARTHKTPERGARILRETRIGRATRYLKTYFNADINDPLHYHLVINTSRVGYDERRADDRRRGAELAESRRIQTWVGARNCG